MFPSKHHPCKFISVWSKNIMVFSQFVLACSVNCQVPEFLMFALERGITDLNLQLVTELLGEPDCVGWEELVALFATLLNFLVFVVVRQERQATDQE